MLSLVEQAEAVHTGGAGLKGLTELTSALVHEHRLIDDLRQALLRQRAGVAADDPEMIEASVHAIGRTLLTLEEARRRRTSLTALVTGQPSVPLAQLEAYLGRALPDALVSAREAVRQAAESTAMELAINQNVLRRAPGAGGALPLH